MRFSIRRERNGIAADFGAGRHGVACSLRRRHIGVEVFINVLLEGPFHSGKSHAWWLAPAVFSHRVIRKQRHHGSDIAPVSCINGLTKHCHGVGLGEPFGWERGDDQEQEYS